jgi:GNAT superfamily N-acetyltransferase
MSSLQAVERLRNASDDDIEQLAELLVDAVDSGASVSFVRGLTLAEARDWWRTAANENTVLLVVRDTSGIVATAQIQPTWAPNQAHRAEVAKVLVHRRARRQGIARTLMQAVEHHARGAKFTLLSLDTCKGSAAEQLYENLGWTRVGEIPKFAVTADNGWCTTVFFYKQL